MVDYGQAEILRNLKEIYENSKPALAFLGYVSLETMLLVPLFFREEANKATKDLKEFFIERYIDKSEYHDKYL